MEKQAAIVLVTRHSSWSHIDREILVTTNRHYGQHALPGGKVEPRDASPREAAVRELKEETSLHVSHCDLSFLFKAINTVTGEDREIHVFYARAVYGVVTNVESGTMCDWFSFNRLINSSVFAPFYQRHFPDGVSHLSPTQFFR